MRKASAVQPFPRLSLDNCRALKLDILTPFPYVSLPRPGLPVTCVALLRGKAYDRLPFLQLSSAFPFVGDLSLSFPTRASERKLKSKL